MGNKFNILFAFILFLLLCCLVAKEVFFGDLFNSDQAVISPENVVEEKFVNNLKIDESGWINSGYVFVDKHKKVWVYQNAIVSENKNLFENCYVRKLNDKYFYLEVPKDRKWEICEDIMPSCSFPVSQIEYYSD